MWVGVLSTLLPKCSTIELKFAQIYVFLTRQFHLDVGTGVRVGIVVVNPHIDLYAAIFAWAAVLAAVVGDTA